MQPSSLLPIANLGQASRVTHQQPILKSNLHDTGTTNDFQTNRPAVSRRPWLILSLPLAMAVLIVTSLYYLSTNAGAPPATFFGPSSTTTARDRFRSLFANGVLSSSSWPIIPLKTSTTSSSTTSITKIVRGKSADSTIASCHTQERVSWLATQDLEHSGMADEDEDEDEEDEEDDDSDDGDDPEEEDEDEDIPREWDAILNFPGGQTVHIGNDLDASEIAELIEDVEERMLATVPRGMESQNVVVLDLSSSTGGDLSSDAVNADDLASEDEMVILNLSRRGSKDDDDDDEDREEKEEDDHHRGSKRRKQEIGINGSRSNNRNVNEDDDEGYDEDKHDHFPTNLKHGGDGRDDNDESEVDDDKEQEDRSRKHRHHSDKDGRHHKHHHQDQNANLGGTGANGPILLCSSRSCLPKLRDSILSKLSVQIQYVMNHLRSRETLFYGMESTAPQTKEFLIATQEDMVQKLEDRIIKDLKDWVMGVRRKSGGTSSSSSSSSSSPSPSSKSKDSSSRNQPVAAFENDQEIVAEMSVESEGLFLGGEDFETEGDMAISVSSTVPSTGFHMPSLSLEDADDDDEDHENEVLGSIKKTKHHSLHRRDGLQNDFFLSADKVIMQEEWSRWIAHWVHHSKLLILSHSLATRTLADMNQIAISGENVVMMDQRHWSWNLDKALATVMVASEMLCGGPSPTTTTTGGSPATLKIAAGSDTATLKALALSLNAQKCVDIWSPELETILQQTATNA
ncbi:hypothetical protein EMPS_06678 [Entomortierella parvispora]|uniref:Uncharacterized protein n=1 Tax=Entomortierella parvispora TaxID=205924 RepID=A0A9P3LXY8_9FUNG|nr:hypothetical protein EMPS_06678 [Entomortierella parvispora]